MNKIPILIVDDNEADRYLLSRHLNETQLIFSIFEMDNGKSALDFLKKHEENMIAYPDEYPPVLIFLDINMPLMNGFEFLEHFAILRRTVSIDTCVVMMITSSHMQEDKNRLKPYEFVKDYLVKGAYSPTEIKEKISAYV